MRSPPSSGISQAFAWVSRSRGQVAYVLLTRSPLGGIAASPFDLHVLGTPPAFILSQDQTLNESIYMDISFEISIGPRITSLVLILNLESTFKCSLSICLVFKDQPAARPARPILMGRRVSHALRSPSWRASKMIRPDADARKG